MVRARTQNNALTTGLLVLFLSACNHSLGESSAAPSPAPPPAPPADAASDDVNFETAQKQVFLPLCQDCHNNSGVFTFTDYETVLSKVDRIRNRVLIQGTMPPGGNLPDPSREILTKWIEGGAPR